MARYVVDCRETPSPNRFTGVAESRGPRLLIRGACRREKP